ncbi:MAG: TraR/DksA C4-type zinc finger protein [Pseudomonadota bacterium]
MDTKYFKQKLLDRREELVAVAEQSAAAAATVELDQTRVGRLSRMDALQGQAMAKATQARRELELTRIDAALKRISQGEFGFCVRCEEDLLEARLEIDPTAVVCVRCADSR